MNLPPSPWIAYAPALSNGSPHERYFAISSFETEAKCTCVLSMNSRRSTSGSRINETPVITVCVRPESFASIWRASSEVRGFPKIAPSNATIVSAAITIAGPTARAATSSAFASARRRTKSCGDSPGTGVSSTAEESTENCIPALRRISARRGEAEARISFMALVEEAYYSKKWPTACPSGQQPGSISQHDGFLVFAENVPQRVGNFSNRCEVFDRRQDRRNQV